MGLPFGPITVFSIGYLGADYSLMEWAFAGLSCVGVCEMEDKNAYFGV